MGHCLIQLLNPGRRKRLPDLDLIHPCLPKTLGFGEECNLTRIPMATSEPITGQPSYGRPRSHEDAPPMLRNHGPSPTPLPRTPLEDLLSRHPIVRTLFLLLCEARGRFARVRAAVTAKPARPRTQRPRPVLAAVQLALC